MEESFANIRESIIESLDKDNKGAISSTIENCMIILRQDPVLADAIAFNILSQQIDIVKELGWARFYPAITEVDEYYIHHYFEKHYKIKSDKNINKAIEMIANENQYNPICKFLEGLQWDGEERIRYCLKKYLGVENEDYFEYSYEVLKLFMLGAIHRVFKPGCKFEMILCLVGGQGAGKSTFFRFLACKDEWFTDDLKCLGDEKVYQKIQGIWIVEFSEMLATINAKSIEEIKSFISRQSDNFRIPYAKNPILRPRQVVFGGTSNTIEFLPLDRTGNRRFVPVLVDMDKAEKHILKDEAESREYIRQMWAEAMYLYKECNCNPTLTYSKELDEYIKEHQKKFMPEDVDEGKILAWLEDFQGNHFCTAQIYKEALGNSGEPGIADCRRINKILKGIKDFDFEKTDKLIRYSLYGRQKSWERKKKPIEEKPKVLATEEYYYPTPDLIYKNGVEVYRKEDQISF